MGVLDIIGTGETDEVTDADGNTVEVEVALEYTGPNPALARHSFAVMAVLHILVGGYIADGHSTQKWAPEDSTYSYVFRSAYYSLYLAWMPVLFTYSLSMALN